MNKKESGTFNRSGFNKGNDRKPLWCDEKAGNRKRQAFSIPFLRSKPTSLQIPAPLFFHKNIGAQKGSWDTLIQLQIFVVTFRVCPNVRALNAGSFSNGMTTVC